MSAEAALWFFLIYSFLGWCVEVAYHAVTLGKVVNRGFLNGPVCPVYGFGMLAVLAVFGDISAETGDGNNLALFFGGMALTTAIELFAGWALDRLFHARWWDYSGEPFNFHGYICPRFSILWGLGTVFVYRIIHTTVAGFTGVLLSLSFGRILLAAAYLLYAVDLGVTVATVRGLNRNLEELDELRRKLRIVSDRISEQIGTGTIKTAQKIEESQVQAALGKAELRDLLNEAQAEKMLKQLKERREENLQELQKKKEELSRRYEEARRKLYRHPLFGAGRLVRAFPGAVHRKQDALLKEFRKKLEASG